MPDGVAVPDGDPVPGAIPRNGALAPIGAPDAPAEPDSGIPTTRRRRSARGAVLVGARVVAGTIGIAIAAAAVAAATWLPLPRHTATAPFSVIVPIAAAQQRVCPGPLLRLGDASGQNAGTASSIGRPDIQASATSGSIEQTPLRSTDNSAGVAPEFLTLAPGETGAASPRLLAGSQSQPVRAGEVAGFAAAECAEAGGESWLVGGATDTGRTTLITLSNPSPVSATVTITVYSRTGAIAAPGSDGIIVPASSQRILSLAGFAPGIVSPVVRVQSRGGQIVANLQQSIVRTLETGGVTFVGASSAPATHTVIPGVVLSSVSAVTARQPNVGYADLATVIRLYVPGDKSAQAKISVQPEGTANPVTPVSVALPAGLVTDVPLDEYNDGSYTISIQTDAQVVAGARVSTIGASGAVDVAWFAAAPELHSVAQVTVAAGPSPALHLANPTTTDAAVTIAASHGADTTVTVPAGSAVAVPVTAAASYTVTGFDALSMAVSYVGDGQLSGFTLSPTAPVASPIRVYQ